MVWLYTCHSAGLSQEDLMQMRIDQAELWLEIHQFIDDAIAHIDEDEAEQDAEDAFWSL